MKIEDNWPYETIRPQESEAVYDLLLAIEQQLDRIDVAADDLQEQRFLDTATTQELDKLAREVGVVPKTDESEERIRFRAQVAKAISRSDGTTPEVAQLLELLFPEDVERFSLAAVTGEPAVRLNMPTEVVEDAPVTQSTLAEMLSDAVPAGDDIQIVTSDDFAFHNTESGAGFDEGEWA